MFSAQHAAIPDQIASMDSVHCGDRVSIDTKYVYSPMSLKVHHLFSLSQLNKIASIFMSFTSCNADLSTASTLNRYLPMSVGSAKEA